jgi:hypothetical protein
MISVLFTKGNKMNVIIVMDDNKEYLYQIVLAKRSVDVSEWLNKQPQFFNVNDKTVINKNFIRIIKAIKDE